MLDSVGIKRSRGAARASLVALVAGALFSGTMICSAQPQGIIAAPGCDSIAAMFLTGGSVGAMAYSPNGRFVAVHFAERLTVWDTERKERLEGFVKREQCLQAAGGAKLAFSNDSKHLSLLSANGVETYDLGSATAPPVVARYRQHSFATTGTISGASNAIALVEDSNILVLDASTGKTLAQHPSRAGEAALLSFSPDGRYLAEGARDSQTMVTPDGVSNVAGNPSQQIELFKVGSAESNIIQSASPYYFAMALSPDDRRVAAISYSGAQMTADNVVLDVWNREDGASLLQLPLRADTYHFLAFTDSGHVVLSGNAYIASADIDSGRAQFQMFDFAHFAPSIASASSADVLAVGGERDSIALFHLPDLASIAVLQ
jgi:WD40 repeat protein